MRRALAGLALLSAVLGAAPSALASHTVTTVVAPNSCYGTCGASATAVVTGGSGSFAYQWSTVPAQTTPTAVGLCAGTYLVVVTDLVNGDQVPAFAIVVDPPPLAAGGSKTDATSALACNGTASVAPTGGTGSYAVSWSPGGSTATTLTGLCAGTYVATVTDLNGCTVSYTANVGAPAPPTPTSFHTLAPCRLADTRGPAGPFGGPGIAANGTRLFDVPASSCGVPPGARAVALNVTVVAAGAQGSLVVTAGDAVSTATSTLSFAAGQTRASNALAALSPAGDVAVTLTAPVSVNVVLDVFGYFE